MKSHLIYIFPSTSSGNIFKKCFQRHFMLFFYERDVCECRYDRKQGEKRWMRNMQQRSLAELKQGKLEITDFVFAFWPPGHSWNTIFIVVKCLY